MAYSPASCGSAIYGCSSNVLRPSSAVCNFLLTMPRARQICPMFLALLALALVMARPCSEETALQCVIRGVGLNDSNRCYHSYLEFGAADSKPCAGNQHRLCWRFFLIHLSVASCCSLFLSDEYRACYLWPYPCLVGASRGHCVPALSLGFPAYRVRGCCCASCS